MTSDKHTSNINIFAPFSFTTRQRKKAMKQEAKDLKLAGSRKSDNLMFDVYNQKM